MSLLNIFARKTTISCDCCDAVVKVPTRDVIARDIPDLDDLTIRGVVYLPCFAWPEAWQTAAGIAA